MKNKKGFTLVELLAVIVVLAIIIIIATISVNKQIKKSRKNANDINKKMIVKAYNMCMTQENDLEKCNSLSNLIANDYLENFEDPYDKNQKNLDDSYTIILDEKDKADVIYHGLGIEPAITKKEAEDYFLWCGNTCVNGLSDKGINWVKKEGDILVFPDYITNIKDGADSNHSFRNIKIKALIAVNKVNINADFSNSEINIVQIDGGSIGTSKFKNSRINKLILGKTKNFSLSNSFPKSKIDYFKMEKGNISWDGFGDVEVGSIENGDGIYYMSGNSIYPNKKVNKIFFNSPCIFKGRRNPYDGNYNGSGWGKGKDKTNCSTSLDEQSKYSFDWFDPPFRLTTNELIIGDNVTIIPSHLFSRTNAKKITIGKNVKTIEENAFNKTYTEEIIIKGDINRFNDIWDKIQFPSKDKVKIIQG